MGPLQMMYWLVKEEIAHTTKYTSLMDLSITLGSDYLKELNLGRNAHYTSEQTIRGPDNLGMDGLRLRATPVPFLCSRGTDSRRYLLQRFLCSYDR